MHQRLIWPQVLPINCTNQLCLVLDYIVLFGPALAIELYFFMLSPITCKYTLRSRAMIRVINFQFYRHQHKLHDISALRFLAYRHDICQKLKLKFTFKKLFCDIYSLYSFYSLYRLYGLYSLLSLHNLHSFHSPNKFY